MRRREIHADQLHGVHFGTVTESRAERPNPIEICGRAGAPPDLGPLHRACTRSHWNRQRPRPRAPRNAAKILETHADAVKSHPSRPRAISIFRNTVSLVLEPLIWLGPATGSARAQTLPFATAPVCWGRDGVLMEARDAWQWCGSELATS